MESLLVQTCPNTKVPYHETVQILTQYGTTIQLSIAAETQHKTLPNSLHCHFYQFYFLACWCQGTRSRGSRVTIDFLEALTERMGLHYCNEATRMAATLLSFMPSQSALPPGNTLSSTGTHSLFFYSLSPLLFALLPFYRPRNLQVVSAFVCACVCAWKRTASRGWLKVIRNAAMCPDTKSLLLGHGVHKNSGPIYYIY